VRRGGERVGAEDEHRDIRARDGKRGAERRPPAPEHAEKREHARAAQPHDGYQAPSLARLGDKQRRGGKQQHQGRGPCRA
jgi:hypothetical protein